MRAKRNVFPTITKIVIQEPVNVYNPHMKLKVCWSLFNTIVIKRKNVNFSYRSGGLVIPVEEFKFQSILKSHMTASKNVKNEFLLTLTFFIYLENLK